MLHEYTYIIHTCIYEYNSLIKFLNWSTIWEFFRKTESSRIVTYINVYVYTYMCMSNIYIYMFNISYTCKENSLLWKFAHVIIEAKESHDRLSTS